MQMIWYNLQDALWLSDLDTIVSHGGQEDEEVTTPQVFGSTLGQAGAI